MPSSVPSTIDIVRARRETPGCERVLHFNNAGAGLMPAPVLDALTGHLRREAEIGGYESEDEAHDAIEHTYDAVATLLGCAREEVALVENATRAWDMAFYSIPFQPGDRILTAEAEYASNYIAYLQVAQRTGARVEVVPSDETGQLSVPALRNMMDERVKLVAVTHIPTNGGLVNPAAEIGAVAREAGALFLLDACQSAGQLPLDVGEIGCDMLSATGRKFLRGPRGTGFLYVRRALLDELEPPFLDLHAATWTAREAYEVRPDARRFENWESYVAGRVGLGVAIDYALSWGLPAIWGRDRELAAQLRAQLAALPGVRVHDQGAVQGAIVTFTVEGNDATAMRDALREQSINVTVSGVSSTRLDMESRALTDMVRASVHYYNTEDEIARFCAAVDRMRP